MRDLHPGLRYDGSIVRVLRDVAKVYVMQLMEQCQEVMRKRKVRVISEEVVEIGAWEVDRKLWRQ